MKLNKILSVKYTILLIALAFASCDKNHGTKPGNAAYMEEAANNKVLVNLTADTDGGITYVSPRIANLSSSNVTLTIGVDKEALNRFNRLNNTIYTPVNSEDVTLVLPDGSEVTGSDIDYVVKAGEVGTSIGVKIGRLDDGVYPPAQKIAIPVTIKKASGLQMFDKIKSVIITINRPLVTSVSKMSGGGFTVEFANDLKEKTIDGWTFQFTANFKSLTRDNLNVGYFGGQEGGFYTRIYGSKGIQVKNGRDGDDTWTQKSLPANKWLQITFVYKDQTVSVYVNGVLQKTFGTTKIFHKEGSSFSIGNDKYDDYLREVRFWSKPLTETEILENLYLPLDPNTEALESYLPLTKEAGLTDLTPHNNIVTKHAQTRVQWIENVKFPSDELVIIE